jgi:polysaccharide export outer membrane protein
MIGKGMFRWLVLAVIYAGLHAPALGQQHAVSTPGGSTGAPAALPSTGSNVGVPAASGLQQGQQAPGQQVPSQQTPGQQIQRLQVPGQQIPAPTTSSRVLQMATEPGLPTTSPTITQSVPAERHEFQDFVAQSLGRDLPMFGFSLFQNVPSTFSPLDRVPVTPDYIVGPGDELVISGWGQVDIDYRAIVDRNGAINIPRVGNIDVTGVRFQDLEAHLKRAIGRVFTNFDLKVTMGQLRSIQIFIVGQALRPGTYTVSSLTTLVNALFVAGGPSVKGSMRTIQLKRGEKLVTEFDMYDLLLKGDKSKDVRLLPGDVIYIPPTGQLTAISGSVNAPAIYEIRGRSTLAELIELAGGLTVTASGKQVAVERIVDRKTRKVENFTLDKEGLGRLLQDGDLVKVFPLSPRFDNAVTVRGNVAGAARHPFRSGMRIKDVVPDRESLIVPDYWIKRNLSVQTGVAAGQDVLRTEVRRSLREVNWDYAVIERLNLPDLTTLLIPFNLERAVLEGDPTQNLQLQPGDVITIFSKDDIQVQFAKQPLFVKLEGEIAVAGVYQVKPGETLRQLVSRVGGLTPNAYLFGAEFERESTRVLKQKQLEDAVDRMEQDLRRSQATGKSDSEKERFPAQLALLSKLRNIKATGRIVLEVPPEQSQLRNIPDLRLEDGDRFFVPAPPATVTVIGTVYNSGVYMYQPERRVADYLALSGGSTKFADASGLFVIRANGTIISKRQSGFFLSSIDREKLMPGDTIVVPEDFDRVNWTNVLKDWGTIFYQLGLGAAALKVLKD